VDNSPHMLATAAQRCGGQANVVFHRADATALPVQDGAFAAALAVQTLEYVPDVTAALRKLHRALREGGRTVIWDMDWSTVSWHSCDPGRMQRVLQIWDRHLAHPSLPRTLASRLRSAGFEDVGMQGHVFTCAELTTDTYAGVIFPFIEQYVAGTGELNQDEITAWSSDQRELNGRGEFFFACIQFCFTATRPA
jgi:arsenite methyltransferase